MKSPRNSDDPGISGFPAIARPDAEILILGSMPGEDSLKAGQYYAHPRNGFWPILMGLLGHTSELTYSQKCKVLVENKIALWDTLKTCVRSGSLDSSIVNSSITPNNFNLFFDTHSYVRSIFFNGRKSQEVFEKKVQPNLPKKYQDLKQVTLPSTSPAMAMLRLEQKQEKWSVILKELHLRELKTADVVVG